MDISDKNLYELLNNIIIDKTKSTDSFFNISEFTIPEHECDDVLNKLIWSGHVIWNQKEDTVTIGEIGKKFMKKYKCKMKRDSFIEYIDFLKQIKWLIIFIFSILMNILFILRLLNIF